MVDERHLYLVVHPNHSLVASQLDAERFIKHYVRESARYFEGKLMFVELDPGFRHPYFDVAGAYTQLKPHEDGSPKATKFISSYRVLEHVDFGAMGKLYVCDESGGFVALDPSQPGTELPRGDEDMRVILEIDPVKFMVLTRSALTKLFRASVLMDSAGICAPVSTTGLPSPASASRASLLLLANSTKYPWRSSVAPIMMRTWASSSTTRMRAGLRSFVCARSSACAVGVRAGFGVPNAARFNPKTNTPKNDTDAGHCKSLKAHSSQAIAFSQAACQTLSKKTPPILFHFGSGRTRDTGGNLPSRPFANP